ncbi:hypothetical protein NE237_019240 [Protea cynaroides]|uniref:pectinesterase n=1 Tax=Protea cynaroides TaxID=273540 RepID=A0A9Q0KBE5_9MAGN|nr:hypothetical protein NE237_019240 [Protea cynaroides]
MEIQIHACVLLLVALASSSLMAAQSTNWSTALLIKVDQSGNGDFKKIQDAIDVVPSNNSDNVFILIKPGIYREKVVVDKPYITLSGLTSKTTIITGNAYGDIFGSATVSVLASDFVARSLTMENTHGAGSKAVALRVSADKAAFYGCKIMSYQDTLLDDTGRHYYNNSYIEGATDFICGDAASLFENCHLHSISKGNGAITAQRRESPSEDTGFSFLGCKITGVGSCFLGRPWGPYSRVVFSKTYMSGVVLPQGWDDWGDSSTHSTVYYGENQCYGAGAASSKRVTWSRRLSDAEAKPFLTMDMIGGQDWLKPTPTHFKRPSYIISKTAGGNK